MIPRCTWGLIIQEQKVLETNGFFRVITETLYFAYKWVVNKIQIEHFLKHAPKWPTNLNISWHGQAELTKQVSGRCVKQMQRKMLHDVG